MNPFINIVVKVNKPSRYRITGFIKIIMEKKFKTRSINANTFVYVEIFPYLMKINLKLLDSSTNFID